MDEIRETLRMLAWERAKAELRGMLHTYYGSPHFDKSHPLRQEHEEFLKFAKLLDDFILQADRLLE